MVQRPSRSSKAVRATLRGWEAYMGGLREYAAVAVAGLGIAFVPDSIVSPEIQSVRLDKVLSQFQPEKAAISAVHPSRRHLSAKVRQLVDDLAAQFAEAAPWRID
jgi:DNA-binding transcriptional LysR family regulator